MAAEVAHRHNNNISPYLSLCVVILLTFSVCASLEVRDTYIDDDYDQDRDTPAAVSTRSSTGSSRTWARRGAFEERRDLHDDSTNITAEQEHYDAIRQYNRNPPKWRRRAHTARLDELEPIIVHCNTEASYTVCDHIYTCYGMENPVPAARMARIHGGHEPYPRTYLPFVVMHDKQNDDLFCGGVLISQFYFLTSAQCSPEPGHEIAIYQTQWSDRPNKPSIGPIDNSGGWCSAKKYDLTHYGITTVAKHDWAIVKLRDPLRPYEPREYGCIPYTAKYMHKQFTDVLEGWEHGPWYDRHIQCYAMGHGWYNPGDNQPSGTRRAMRVIKVKPVPCGFRYIGFDKSTGLCFESAESNNSGVCTRDIGGPVLCRMPHEYTKWWVVGIISSFINSSCEGPFFATHVPSVIDDIINECL